MTQYCWILRIKPCNFFTDVSIFSNGYIERFRLLLLKIIDFTYAVFRIHSIRKQSFILPREQLNPLILGLMPYMKNINFQIILISESNYEYYLFFNSLTLFFTLHMFMSINPVFLVCLLKNGRHFLPC